MKAYFLFIILSILTPNLLSAQIEDSIGFSILTASSPEKMNDLYEVKIVNGKNDPICIMHSAYINLFFDPPQRLALQRVDKLHEFYSLHYSARDSSNIYENSNPSYNAEPILPNQEIKFRIFIPKSEMAKRIVFEYLILPDFCYRDFKRAIYANTATWYEKDKIQNISFNLPK